MTETVQTEGMVVASKSEIPSGNNYIWFNPGHTRQLIEAGLIGQESIYHVSGEKRPVASVAIDVFLNNHVLKENRDIEHPSFFTKEVTSLSQGDRRVTPAQDFLFGIIEEELGQKGPLENIQEILEQIESGKLPIIPGKTSRMEAKVENYRKDVPRHYSAAIATRNLVDSLPGPESKQRLAVKKSVEEILSKSLEEEVRVAEERSARIKDRLTTG